MSDHNNQPSTRSRPGPQRSPSASTFFSPNQAANKENNNANERTRAGCPNSRSFEQQPRSASDERCSSRSALLVSDLSHNSQPEEAQHKSRLGPVRSLDAADSFSGASPLTAKEREQQQRLASDDLRRDSIKKPMQQQQQQRQIFSLKQLAGEKRGSLQVTPNESPTTSTSIIPFKLRVQNSLIQHSKQLNKDKHPAASGESNNSDGLAETLRNSAKKSERNRKKNKLAGERADGSANDHHHHHHQSSSSFDEEEEEEEDSSHEDSDDSEIPGSDDDSDDSYIDDDDDDDEEEEEEEDGPDESNSFQQYQQQESLKSSNLAIKSDSLNDLAKVERRQQQMKMKMKNCLAVPGSSSSSNSKGKSKGKGKKKAHQSKKRHRSRAHRRTSCCNCEPIINRIDFDCQPVTDIDLVTYKHLCQLEQKQQQLRAHQRRGGRKGAHTDEANLPGGPPGRFASMHQRYNLQAPFTNKSSPASAAAGAVQQLKRRSSLQEESGAYYQLCITPEEQQIRQKYVWFPPSLKSLQLVDQFFSYFPKDKIPYNPSAGQMQADGKQTGSLVQAITSQDKTTKESGQQQQAPAPQHPASSLACSSYRDEQISFQLPRQDISLDYCSYHMSEASRSSYLQFVDKRNSQSLDVGTVTQIRSSSSAAAAAAAVATNKSDPSRLASRKLSTASQVSTLESTLVSGTVSARDQAGPGAIVSQRCRRCLVRFEEGQLAVVAPNFSIGTGLYQRAQGRVAAAATQLGLQADPNCAIELLAVGQSRRGSMSVQQPPSVPTLDENDAIARTTIASTTAATINKQNMAMFHPNCFTCATCKEFLVDLVYCLRESKLYCLRHYGESVRPRCSWCQELIFSDEYLKAMNENFHVDHFLCRHCDSNLAGQRYVLKEERPYCIGCYEENFANTCEDCQKPIGIDSRDLSYKERHWHDTCFLCQQCQQSLIDKPFGSKGDKVYCADCYDSTFATRCDGCKNPFRAGSKKMEYRGRQWHDSCFCCVVCKNTIGSNSFIPKNEEIYCIKCYEDKYATRCTKCKQVIVSGGVTFRNEPWHRDCFNCCNCNKSLAGHRFTTKDTTTTTQQSDTNSTTNLNKTNQPHNAYCIECYGELFAKKCFACSQAITGLGGTRFVTFEDRSWHNDCFICNDCRTSLVGKGFITDGPDTILCGECARAKLR